MSLFFNQQYIVAKTSQFLTPEEVETLTWQRKRSRPE